jgi:hypothetical protein
VTVHRHRAAPPPGAATRRLGGAGPRVAWVLALMTSDREPEVRPNALRNPLPLSEHGRNRQSRHPAETLDDVQFHALILKDCPACQSDHEITKDDLFIDREVSA